MRICGRPNCDEISRTCYLEHVDAVKKTSTRENAAVYRERNRLAVAIARLSMAQGLAAGVATDDTAEEGFRTVLFVDLPAGQVSWHIADSDRDLVVGLPPYDKPWDKHSTEENHARVAAITDEPSPLLKRVATIARWVIEDEHNGDALNCMADIYELTSKAVRR